MALNTDSMTTSSNISLVTFILRMYLRRTKGKLCLPGPYFIVLTHSTFIFQISTLIAILVVSEDKDVAVKGQEELQSLIGLFIDVLE